MTVPGEATSYAVHRRRLALALALVVGVAGAVWWGLHPPRTDAAYRSRTVETIEGLRSQVATAELWLTAVESGRSPVTSASVGLEEAETDATSLRSTFSSWQPPGPRTRQLRTEVTGLADQVVAALGEIRVAAHDGRWQQATELAPRLRRLDRRLERLEQEAQP